MKTISKSTIKVEGNYYRHECNRCMYVWYSTKKLPKSCANRTCKSPYWNRPRMR